jgi:hypothetical protein
MSPEKRISQSSEPASDNGLSDEHGTMRSAEDMRRNTSEPHGVASRHATSRADHDEVVPVLCGIIEDSGRRFSSERDGEFDDARAAAMEYGRIARLVLEPATQSFEESCDPDGARGAPTPVPQRSVVDLGFDVQECQEPARAHDGQRRSSGSRASTAEVRRNENPNGQPLLMARHSQDWDIDCLRNRDERVESGYSLRAPFREWDQHEPRVVLSRCMRQHLGCALTTLVVDANNASVDPIATRDMLGDAQNAAFVTGPIDSDEQLISRLLLHGS